MVQIFVVCGTWLCVHTFFNFFKKLSAVRGLPLTFWVCDGCVFEARSCLT
jgi:hypothetical protein